MKLKIVHVIIGLEKGGAEIFLIKLATLQSKTDSVAIVSLTNVSTATRRNLESNGVQLISFGLTGLGNFLSTFKKLREFLKISRPDIIQSWMYHSDFLTSLASVGLHLKIVWSVRNTIVPARSTVTKILMHACSFISYFSPRAICFVAHASKIYHQGYGYSKKKSLVIGNGYDFSNHVFDGDVRKAMREKLGLNNDVFLFGVVGRYHKDKGQDLFIEAFSRIVSFNSNVKAILVGKFCSYDNQELVNLLEVFGIKDNVFLVGEQENVSVWYSIMDSYVMPSRTEGFPNALAEAMAIGLTCVACDVGDARVVGSDFVRFCLPTPNELMNAMLEILLLTTEQRALIGQHSKMHVIESFSIFEVEKKYKKLYQDIVE